MKTPGAVVPQSFVWNVMPFFVTWLLLTAVSARFLENRFGETGFEAFLSDSLPALLVVGSMTAGLLGTLAVAVPVVLVDHWSKTQHWRVQLLAVVPLVVAELTIGFLARMPIVPVALFTFLQWTYWTFMCFIRDTTGKKAEVAETEQVETTSGHLSPVNLGPPDMQSTISSGQPKAKPDAEELDTDTTIENLEASMVELANQIMEEKET